MLSKSIRLIIILVAVATAAYAPSAFADAELETVRKQMASKFPNLDPQNINRGPVAGLLEIRQGAMVAYLTIDGRYLMQGELIDLDNNVNLTEAAMNTGRREALKDVTDSYAITFSPDNPRHTVTVFTDIDCTFCRKLHREIAQYNAEGIAVRYLMYPRSGPNTRSWEKAEEVWCSDDRLDAMTQAKNDKSLPAATCDAGMIRQHFQKGLNIGLEGTPAIVTEDGALISGYMPAKALAARLDGTG